MCMYYSFEMQGIFYINIKEEVNFIKFYIKAFIALKGLLELDYSKNGLLILKNWTY